MEKPVNLSDIIESKNEFTEEEFNKLLQEYEFADKGNGADTDVTSLYGDTLSLAPAKKQHAHAEVKQPETQVTPGDKEEITSATDLSAIRKEEQQQVEAKLAKKPNPICTVDGKTYYDSPFIAKQQQKFPKSTRIREKVVKVFDLSEKDNLVEFNNILNDCMQDFSNIANFQYQLKTFENANTWKVLAMYDIVEFQNPFSN